VRAAARVLPGRENPVQYGERTIGDRGRGEMAGIRIVVVLYTIMFVVMVLIVIGSIFGVFNNSMIDPGL
jgi:ABC-type lipoprotein release transport system permease subunit